MKCSVVKATLAGLVLAGSVAVAALTDAEKFNQVAREILAPLNNELTDVSVTANSLVFDADKLVEINLDEVFVKKGRYNQFSALGNFAYTTENDQMLFSADVLVGLDLPVAFGQPTLNEYAPLLADYAKDLVTSATEQYGDAIAIEARVFDEVYDNKNDIESLKFEASVDIDLSKLSPELLERTFLKSGSALLDITRTGVDVELSIELNPDYYYFKSENKYIRDYFAKIVQKDAEVMEQFYSTFNWLDGMITNIVDNKYEEENP